MQPPTMFKPIIEIHRAYFVEVNLLRRRSGEIFSLGHGPRAEIPPGLFPAPQDEMPLF